MHNSARKAKRITFYLKDESETRRSRRIYNESRSLREKDEVLKVCPSSRPQTGIRWPPISGPRTRFFARSHRGSHSPACAGLFQHVHSRGRVPPQSMATLNCARSAGPCGDGERYRCSTLFIRDWCCCYCCCCCCCDLGLSLSFVISSISHGRGRYRFISNTPFRGSLSPPSTSSALPSSVPDLPVA